MGLKTNLARRTHPILSLLFLLLLPLCLHAQESTSDAAGGDTRAGSIAQQEEAKDKSLKPQEPPHGEAKFDTIQRQLIDPFINPNGLTPKFGGLPTGGGFSLGPQYTRRDLFREHLTANAFLVGSTKLWYTGQVSFNTHDLLENHLEFRLDAAYQNAASVFYFGEGSDSLKSGKTNFRREFTTTHFGGKVHLLDQKFTAGYIVGGLLAHVGPGRLTDPPTIESLYNGNDTPGLAKQSSFMTGTSLLEFNFTHPGYITPKGFLFEIQDSQFWDRGGLNNSFHLLQTQASYSIPFFNGMRAISLRARNQTTFHSDNQVVPFYLQPTLGGPDDLRGYERYRFYDNGSSLVSAEYRISISGILEMAVFGDGGDVYHRAGLIGFRDMRGDGGVGLRVKSKDQTVMRFDVGFSPEGVQLWFVFDPYFNKLSRLF
jgi:outer membrane protein assembly factor BamA